MNTLSADRRLRLVARLTAGTARTYGLLLLAGLAVAEIASILFRAAGNRGDFIPAVLGYLPFLLIAIAWTTVARTYPSAIASGVTRQEYLRAYVLYSVIILATVVLAGRVASLFARQFDPLYNETASYVTVLDTVTQAIGTPVTYFAAGTAAGALYVYLHRRILGIAAALAVIGLVEYRMSITDPGRMGDTIELLVDAVAAAVCIAAAWLLLRRADMRPKQA